MSRTGMRHDRMLHICSEMEAAPDQSHDLDASANAVLFLDSSRSGSLSRSCSRSVACRTDSADEVQAGVDVLRMTIVRRRWWTPTRA